MNTNRNIDNTIFTSALMGVLLFIGAMGFEIAGLANLSTLQLPYTIIAFILGSSSVFLLYRAIKFDRYRRV